MNQKINVCLLSEAINGFMKEGFSLIFISCEPYGEIVAMINLLLKFAQLLINNFALIDYAAKQAALSALGRRRAWRESNRERPGGYGCRKGAQVCPQEAPGGGAPSGIEAQAGIDFRIALSRVCAPEVRVASTRVRIPIGSPAPWVGTGRELSRPRRRSSFTAPEGTNQI